MAKAAAHSAPRAMQPAAGRNPLVSDPLLLVAALLLTAVGLVMVYTASTAVAGERYGDTAYLFRHQLFHVAMGLAALVCAALVDYRLLRKMVYPAIALILVLLVLVLIPGVGHSAGGSARWLRLGPVSIQPSELAKVALVLYLAYSLSEHYDSIKSFSHGIVPHFGMACILMLPILAEPDMGMSVMLLAITWCMLFAAGARLGYLLGMVVTAAPLVWWLIASFPYRAARLMAFTDPWEHRFGAGFQIVHSFMALGSGGMAGQGLGESKQKLFYLPEPHTDFIFSVLGEELGLWGTTLVITLFSLLIWRGIRIALDARDLLGTYLALGATLIVGLQAFINLGVVMGMLPTKGLTLPFMSYGGSSLVVNCACVGLLLSVAARKGKAA